MKKTLGDRVIKNFSKVKLRKASVRVPRLNVKKANAAKSKSDDRIPISSIINILIKSAAEKAKKERKERAHEDKSYKLAKEELPSAGGYGSVSKSYGISPHSSYVDYKKLFSYLGKFRAKSAYEDVGDTPVNASNEENAFALIGIETMDKGARYVKYFFPKGADFHATLTSLVPIAGMSSSEWEQFKLWMKVDPVMYALKTSTS
ncbi:hypothetical protein HYW20_06225 [Candidatus Woesearchaeota archaeon]|nr:hypothetical protein [Candidatus Woesearchaeota archaeon]